MCNQARSFHLFNDLPKELQIHIVDLAAEPDTRENIHNSDLLSEAVQWSSLYKSIQLFKDIQKFMPGLDTPIFYLILKKKPALYATRTKLTATTRLTRQVALEAWRNDMLMLDLEALCGEVPENPGFDVADLDQALLCSTMEELEKGREEVLDMVEGMLKEVRERMEAEHPKTTGSWLSASL